MRGKLLFVAGAAVGYVLGARAGRKRYEQIKSAAAKVWESPGIQKQVNAVEDYAAAKFGEIPGALFEGTKKVVTTVVNRAQTAQQQGSGYSRPTPAAPRTLASAGSDEHVQCDDRSAAGRGDGDCADDSAEIRAQVLFEGGVGQIRRIVCNERQTQVGCILTRDRRGRRRRSVSVLSGRTVTSND